MKNRGEGDRGSEVRDEGEKREDIESDSRRTGHNFRQTRSELLMTSLPPPHHSRSATFATASLSVSLALVGIV